MDRIFHQDSHKFANNIYSTRKGQIRLQILTEDLSFLAQSERPLKVLDAGAGLGQISQVFAAHGHQVVHLDGSEKMVQQAKLRHAALGLSKQYEYRIATIQSLKNTHEKYDVILCHAVLEWLAEPFEAIQILNRLLAKAGWLSLMFYNRNAKVMANMVFGNFDYVAAGLEVKKKVRFSPTQPLEIAQVKNWVSQLPLTLFKHSGIRCFNDYLKENRPEINEVLLFELEQKYARIEPFRSLGRYQHFLLKKGS